MKTVRQERNRRIAYGLCMLAAGLIVVGVFVRETIFPMQKGYTSVYAASTVPPMVAFTAESVFNTGDAEALAAFPGVGQVIAQRIIDLRETVRGYRLPEDLLLVKGIGQKTLEKMMNALEEPLETIFFVPRILPDE